MAVAALADGSPGELRLTGTLGFGTAATLWPERQRVLAAASGGRVAVDLGGVEHIDSAGLALLVAWLAEARAAGVELRYSGAPDRLLAIARISDVDAMLTGPLPPRR